MALSENKHAMYSSKMGHSPIPEMDEDQTSSARSSAHARNVTSSDGRERVTVLEKDTSRAEITSVGMGSKTASLHLSRTKSSLATDKDRQADRQSNDGGNSRPSESRGTDAASRASSALHGPYKIHPNSAKFGQFHPAVQREFTFTGYDIMADNDPEEIINEDEAEREKRENVQCYLAACKMLNLIPVTYVAKHINDKEVVMKSHPLGPTGTRALCVALVRNKKIQVLDLEDNDMGEDGAVAVVEMLRENSTVQELHLAENQIGAKGACGFRDLMKDGKKLHTLDLSGNNLDDSNAKCIADILEFNSHLKVLSVKHNCISDSGGFDIGRAIAINDTLQELDLSWNHIRGKGAIAVAIGVQKNVALKRIDLSWNGMALDGVAGLGKALEENRTLKELDISNNRICVKAVGALLKGLQQNEGLATLRMGQNPFSPEVALTILKAIEQSDKCVLTSLDLSDIVVRMDFLKTWDEIKRKRTLPLRILFGAVVKSGEAIPVDPNAIDWRDPVVRMFKFMQDMGYRVIDLLKRFDKDRNFSVDRAEFKMGMMSENIPLTAAQLDEVIDRLDSDGDGEVDLGELIKGEKEFRRKMHARMRKLGKQLTTADITMQKLKQINNL